MATADAIPDDRDVTRDKLVSAAAEVFAEKGYDRAGVQEIARRAGLTTGAIYGRFTGKAELLHAAIEDHTTDELDELFNQHRFEGQASAILRTVGAHLVTPTCDDPDEGALLLEAFVAARRDDDVRGLLADIIEARATVLAQLIETAKSDGTIDAALDTESLVTFCHALGLGFLLFDAIAKPLPAAVPWEQLITRLVAAVAPGDPPDPKGDRP
ncbi:MAG: helix-turn-helix domain-containing protein [Acidimicrobiales bacterium]